MKESENPFKGLERKRLPALHLITACEGGVPLREALAGHIFVMLHDKIIHHCLIKSVEEKIKEEVMSTVKAAKSSGGAGLAGVFGIMHQSALVSEEWSYLNDTEIFTFLLLADSAIEQTQRWIAAGKQKPYNIPLGDLVQRPAWAVAEYDSSETIKNTEESRETVKKLKAEVVAG